MAFSFDSPAVATYGGRTATSTSPASSGGANVASGFLGGTRAVQAQAPASAPGGASVAQAPQGTLLNQLQTQRQGKSNYSRFSDPSRLAIAAQLFGAGLGSGALGSGLVKVAGSQAARGIASEFLAPWTTRTGSVVKPYVQGQLGAAQGKSSGDGSFGDFVNNVLSRLGQGGQ